MEWPFGKETMLIKHLHPSWEPILQDFQQAQGTVQLRKHAPMRSPKLCGAASMSVETCVLVGAAGGG